MGAYPIGAGPWAPEMTLETVLQDSSFIELSMIPYIAQVGVGRSKQTREQMYLICICGPD